MPTQNAATAKRADTEAIVAAMRRIVADHPAWGVRKVWAVLRRDGLVVGYRRSWALRKANGLCLEPDAPRGHAPRRGHMTTELPNRRGATDLTTVWTKEDGPRRMLNKPRDNLYL
jgi:transposase InsO family protein